MREIKFRFFDKIKKRVLDVERLIFPIDENNYCIVTTEGYFRINEGQLMQYTGLKDKNDKEIYEGDILQGMASGDIYKVTFNRGCFTITNITHPNANLGLVGHSPRYLEIIGNIYENKELLEVE